MKDTTVIGILAGMGPRSTTPFLESVLDQCQIQYGAKYDIDYPHIVIYSLPTPFYLDREINDNDMKNALLNGLTKLVNLNVKFISVPCNTVHQYFDEVLKDIKIPVLNMIEISISRIPVKLKKIGLLATPSTISSNVYQGALTDRGIEIVLDDDLQAEVVDLISSVKENNDKSLLIDKWNRLANQFKDKGSDGLIIACTDLAFVNSANHYGMNIIDSSKCLAEATIEEYLRSM